MTHSMIRFVWTVAGVAIIACLGVAVVPLTEGNIQSAHAQELASLSPSDPDVKPVPPTPIAQKKAELGDDQTWNPLWDIYIEKALPSDMLSPKVAKAVKPLCPRFNALNDTDKRAFWAYFFQALAGAEAGLVPTRNVRHTDPVLQVRDDVTHRIVRQEGLLQLTYMDQERYGCDFDWEKDKDLPERDPEKSILQPKNNLLCGINIIHNQLIDQHKPLLSSTSYFATLQPGTVSVRVFLRQMKNVPMVCRRPVEEEQQSQPQLRQADGGIPSFSTRPAGAARSSFVSQDGANLTH